MSVVGIDFGNDSCYISVARKGGIESIANDYSLRATPSYVAFGEKSRTMGVAAKSGQMTQVTRTFFGFKRLLGRRYDDPHVAAEASRMPFDVIRSADGGAVVKVPYCGQEAFLSAEQLTGALFTKLKDTAEVALTTKVHDVVISVPSYFTDAERRALLDSAKIAGLNVLKIMNDTTATALAYGIYKQDLPESDKPARNVIFVDVGHTGTQVSATSFYKGKLTMLACASNASGGRNFDEAICGFFVRDFAERYKLNVPGNKKASLKLMTEAEKLKKLMSANQNQLPINIECFMEDKDVKGFMNRDTFEELIAGDLVNIENTLRVCLEASKLKLEDIYSVEIVGGSSRIPSIKALIEKVYGQAPKTTLNADESVSRGCALQCAILSPTFKVREFSVTDLQPYPIKLVWDNSGGADLQGPGEMEVFPAFHPVPFSKMLTFYKTDTFRVAGEYSCAVPYPDRHIGFFEVGDVTPNPEGGSQKVKVKVRVNPNGVFGVASANLVEKVEIEEEVPVEMEVDEKVAEGTPKEGEAAPTADSPESGDNKQTDDKMETNDAAKKPEEKKEVKMEKRKKMVNKQIDLPVSGKVQGQLSNEKLLEQTSLEMAMNNADRAEAERLNAKNAVEEYIYDVRGKLCEELEDFMLEEERNSFTLELEDAENWLYEDGEYAEKVAYHEKLATLRKKGEAVKKRRQEFQERPAAINQLGQCLQLAQKAVDAYKAGDEKYSHLDQSEVDNVQSAISEKQDWFNRMCGDLQKLAKTSDPPVLAAQFTKEKDGFWHMAKKVLNKPKPKVEPPPQPKEGEGSEKAADEATGASPENASAADSSSSEKTATVNGDMDVD